MEKSYLVVMHASLLPRHALSSPVSVCMLSLAASSYIMMQLPSPLPLRRPHYDVLLSHVAMLPLEFEPPTPSITHVRSYTHSAIEPLRFLDLHS
jgi:hypothetical protein